MKVLVVDDSVVFRSQIKAVLETMENVEVTGSAATGSIALAKLDQTPVDLITLDVEMPGLNGIETLKELRKRGHKARVIMFSSLTTKGASVALEALRLGADDVVAKPSGEGMSLENAASAISADLVPKIKQFINAGPVKHHGLKATSPAGMPASSVVASVTIPTPKSWDKKTLQTFRPEIVVIGTSTGGPKTLEEIFSQIKQPLRVPILIVQHMPPVFTKCLADRIQDLTGITTVEATHLERIEKNKIYVAPGNFHMTLSKGPECLQILLDQTPPQNMVRPAVDPLFESAAKIFGDKTMGFILTGMGEDGRRGCEAIKHEGGGIMIQNKESSIVFGMPGAVFQCGAYDGMGDIAQVTKTLMQMTKE